MLNNLHARRRYFTVEIVTEIDTLIEAIENELSLLEKVTNRLNADLDTRGVEDMARWLAQWEPLKL
jgi:hypothetical protein